MTEQIPTDLSTGSPEAVYVELAAPPATGSPVPPALPPPDAPPVTFAGDRGYPDDVRERLAADAQQIIAQYPQPRSALLPLLHLTQSEDGYITRAGIEFCAAALELSPAEVAGVVTFYSMYRRNPTGEYLVGVCTNTLCAIMGGDEILATASRHLGLEPGESTDDGRITIDHVECNAACDFAPVVMVNWEFFDDQTPASTVELIEDLRAGVAVTPTRGTGALCSFRQTARLLAGLDEPAAGQNSSPDQHRSQAENRGGRS